MSDSFDPYYIWLGIPPKDQPPNHYRLLGLENLEVNTDVIDAAANRQTTYLHEMAAGPNRRESQQLLNEIAAARRCLLSPEKKQEYDENLRANQAAQNAAPPAAVPVAVPVAQVVAPPAAAQVEPDVNPVAEIPNFDFAAENSPGPAVSIDVGQSGADAPSGDMVTPAADAPVIAASGSTPTSAAKKNVPKQWIIAGCSIAAAAIAAFALSNGTEEPKPQPKQETATSEENRTGDTTSTEVASASPDDESTGAEKEAPKKKSEPSLFDQAGEAESIFSLPSNFGSKDKKKK